MNKLRLLMKAGIPIALFFLVCFQSFATTWGYVYPYTEKTENRVKIKSYPYDPYLGPYGEGESFIYRKGKLLYTINHYLVNEFFTYNSGEYFIEVDFELEYHWPSITLDSFGNRALDSPNYEGKAISIYKNGEIQRVIQFSELEIDINTIHHKRQFSPSFSWGHHGFWVNFHPSQMEKRENACIIGDDLNLITCDNQIISLNIQTGKITRTKNATTAILGYKDWPTKSSKRKYNYVDYPGLDTLPNMANGMYINQALKQFLNSDSIITVGPYLISEFDVYTFILNNEGKCEKADIKLDIEAIPEDIEYLDTKIKAWLTSQVYDTTTIPKGFKKLYYTAFVEW